MSRKRIVIIDDHPLFREGLKAIIAREDRFEVIGEAGDGRSGLQLIKELEPDLVLVDLTLPDQSGVTITREVRNLLPNTKVMVISMHSKIDYITEAFRAGATGYLIKESAAGRLLEGLERVLRGEYFLDSALSQKLADRLMETEQTTDEAYQDLTTREQEILRLRAQGLSMKDISQRLCISPKTVENHCTNLMKKLNLHSSIDLARYAAKFGLIDVDEWKE